MRGLVENVSHLLDLLLRLHLSQLQQLLCACTAPPVFQVFTLVDLSWRFTNATERFPNDMISLWTLTS
jgi:hypothetical protein